jgi:hypothetical protein
MVTFTSAATKRIISAVRKVEATKRDRTGERTLPGPDEQSFFAFLSGCSVNGQRYNFVRVFPDLSTDSPDITIDNNMKWRITEPTFTGLEQAYEANGQRGLNNIVVRLNFAGYNADGDPTYVFIHNLEPVDNGLPIHDHRDNYNGGFAFAVYHPGTGLPQQKFFP